MAMDDDMADMDHGDMGMMDEAEMEELRDLQGDEFDRRFMEAMIVHHEGAIDMAERALGEGQDAEVAGLAEAVIAAQEAEIDQDAYLARRVGPRLIARCGLDEKLTRNQAAA
jgi:uncharacterized protein (DUF305 family)